jgi:hypothetical protein
MRRSVLLACLAFTACDPSLDENVPGGEVEEVNAAATSVVTCNPLTFTKGALPGGQSAATLAQKEQTGTQDTWSKYVEFSKGSESSCSFGVGAAPVAGLSVAVNYRGPKKSEMRWTFDAYDNAAKAWVNIGDNAFAPDWTWAAKTFALPAPIARFVSNQLVKIRYKAIGTADVSQLDLWTLSVTSGTTTPPDAGTTNPPDAGPITPPDGTIWMPKPGTTWQWQLQGTLDTSFNVQVYDIDLFSTSKETIAALHASGRKVICYFSAGTREDWRPDASQFPASAVGRDLPDWEGENWLDTRNSTVRSIMKARLDQARDKKCDGVEPDNVDGFTVEKSAGGLGFKSPLTAATQLDYNLFLATEAHARGLSVGLKNDLEQVNDLQKSFDWALNESCGRFTECGDLKPFITANKAVFHVEYTEEWGNRSTCPSVSNTAGFSNLLKHRDLEAWRVACP